jgi:hypothetical protein
MSPGRVLFAALCAIALGAIGCGGSSHEQVDPEKMLEQAAAHPIRSAQLDIDSTIRLSGGGAPSTPLHLHLAGPYSSGWPTAIPSFDWKMNLSALGFPLDGRLVSTGENVYLSVYGNRYQVGEATVADANARIAAAAASGPALNPSRWLAQPTVDGEGNEGGADCERIKGSLGGEAFGRDLNALVTASGSPAVSVSGDGSACVGFDDRVLHELDVDADLRFPDQIGRLLGGADAAHVEAQIEISDVGEPQRIATPRGSYRPIRDLFLTLNDFGVPIPLG